MAFFFTDFAMVFFYGFRNGFFFTDFAMAFFTDFAMGFFLTISQWGFGYYLGVKNRSRLQPTTTVL